jgi:hypothetical protein
VIIHTIIRVISTVPVGERHFSEPRRFTSDYPNCYPRNFHECSLAKGTVVDRSREGDMQGASQELFVALVSLLAQLLALRAAV